MSSAMTVYSGHFLSDSCVHSTLKGYGVSLLHQSGRKGHCSVEDALAALHIYKLVENEMESELWSKMSKREELPRPGPVSIDHYMQDQYWPDHLTDDGQ